MGCMVVDPSVNLQQNKNSINKRIVKNSECQFIMARKYLKIM